jgi:hypothetical protein
LKNTINKNRSAKVMPLNNLKFFSLFIQKKTNKKFPAARQNKFLRGKDNRNDKII